MRFLMKLEEKTLKTKMVALVIPRWMKTMIFLINMLISLLLFSAAPILLIAADALLPSACFSATLPPSSLLSLRTFSSLLANYDFRRSLIDIPLLSLARSLLILCVYSLCDGPRLSRGPYMAVATVCSAVSLVFVSWKGSYVFMNDGGGGGGRAMVVALFACSAVLAIGHVVVAYRISCRERRKLLVYKIDIEAVAACKKGFPRFHKKMLQRVDNKLKDDQIYISF